MATGSHGLRFQYDYSHDRPGLTGAVSAGSARWLRLIRAGDTITGYDSTDGSDWQKIAAARLPGLPATVNVGLFATSPVTYQNSSAGSATRATATFDHLSLTGTSASGAWTARSIGMSPQNYYPILGAGSAQHSGTRA